jgi:hypothetical protein
MRKQIPDQRCDLSNCRCRTSSFEVSPMSCRPPEYDWRRALWDFLKIIVKMSKWVLNGIVCS